jgi:hypothetical protein
MFAGKARSLHWSGAPEKVGSSLTCKHFTRLERLSRDKHSGLLQKPLNYSHKKFYNTGPMIGFWTHQQILGWIEKHKQ